MCVTVSTTLRFIYVLKILQQKPSCVPFRYLHFILYQPLPRYFNSICIALLLMLLLSGMHRHSVMHCCISFSLSGWAFCNSNLEEDQALHQCSWRGATSWSDPVIPFDPQCKECCKNGLLILFVLRFGNPKVKEVHNWQGQI